MFCLNYAIEIGDIVLFAGGEKHSKVISAFTRGPFSHACVVVGRSQIIEAITSSGVQYTSCSRIAVADRANIAVLRPEFPDETRAKAVRSDIEDVAKAFQSRAYSLLDALKMPLHTKRPLATDKYFCSHLVAAIYREAKFPLFDEKHDHNVSPNDFLRNSLLVDVTDDVLMEPPDYVQRRLQKGGYALPGLDAGGSTTSQHAMLFQEFVKDSGPIFRAYGIQSPMRMFDIIDALTDPANSAVASTIDHQLTSLFDSKNIFTLIRLHIGSELEERLDELEEEISIFGQRFILEEHQWCIEASKGFQKKLDDLTIYEEAFLAVHKARGFGYAQRMCEYYQLHMKNANELLRVIDKRAAFLAPHLE